MGESHSGTAEQGGGGAVLCVRCLLIKNPRFSALCEGRGRSCACGAETWLVGSRVEGVGPRPPPREREHSGEREAARNCSGDLNSERSPQAGTVLFYPRFPSPTLPPQFSPRKKGVGKLSWVCPGARPGHWSPGGCTLSCQTHQQEPAEWGGLGLRPASVTFTLISGRN